MSMSAAPSYSALFRRLTGGRATFPYQTRLWHEPWPDLLTVPTGLGKTTAVVVVWLYKRLSGDAGTPGPLVYCLPMRVLVEPVVSQAEACVVSLCGDLEARGRAVLSFHRFLGGALDRDWADPSERPAFIVGTQNMLLSTTRSPFTCGLVGNIPVDSSRDHLRSTSPC